MKSKKVFHGILIAAAVMLLTGLLWLGFRTLPTIFHGVRICELLRPVLESENSAMHVSLKAERKDDSFETEADVFQITQAEVPYLVFKQNQFAVYISGQMLLLENGKAFRIGEAMPAQPGSTPNLLAIIGLLREGTKISKTESEDSITYGITLDQIQLSNILSVIPYGKLIPDNHFEALRLELTEKNGSLDQITVSSNGASGTGVIQYKLWLSEFQILSAGAYPIPQAVQQSAASVDPESLFSLNEDLYRLIRAFAPFTDSDTIDGSLTLSVDCGLLQLETQTDLNEITNRELDPQKLQAVPAMLGWLCMEGDIRCDPNGSGYQYTLALNEESMAELSEMILPALVQYAGSMTQGIVTIQMDAEQIVSIEISIAGKLNALITTVPIEVSAEFHFV